MSRSELTNVELVVDSDAERVVETALRPKTLDEFHGQDELISHLRIVLGSAKARGEVVEHLLFVGPPGLGKTTLATIVANEMHAPLHVSSGPVLQRPGDVAAILTTVNQGDALFIDEIHRLPRACEEMLYAAMEDRQLDVVVGKGPSARSLRLEIPPFSLLAATTRTGLVAGPLRDRFGFVGQLDLYAVEALTKVVQRSAAVLDISIDEFGAHVIAARGRGTPRVANRLLRRVRDYVEMGAGGTIGATLAAEALAFFGVDDRGLDKVDRRILQYLCEIGPDHAVGLATLAHACGEEAVTIEDAHEPFLLREGLILRTPRGRLASPKAFAHMNITYPAR